MPRFRKQFDNNLTAVLFENDRRSKDGDPDMKGQCEVEGVEYWVAAWWNNHKSRGDYLKLKLTPKESDDRSPQQRNNDYQRDRRSDSARGPSGGSRSPQYGREGGMDRGSHGRGERPVERAGSRDEMDDDIQF